MRAVDGVRKGKQGSERMSEGRRECEGGKLLKERWITVREEID